MESLLTPQEVARLWSVQLRTVYAWVARRKIPYQKIGRTLRFSPTALGEWLASQRDSATNEKRSDTNV